MDFSFFPQVQVVLHLPVQYGSHNMFHMNTDWHLACNMATSKHLRVLSAWIDGGMPDTSAKKYQSMWYKYMSILRDYLNGLENAGLTARCKFQSAVVEDNVSAGTTIL